VLTVWRWGFYHSEDLCIPKVGGQRMTVRLRKTGGPTDRISKVAAIGYYTTSATFESVEES